MGVPIIAEFNLQEREQWNVTNATSKYRAALQREEIW